jgi:hypothetical protein
MSNARLMDNSYRIRFSRIAIVMMCTALLIGCQKVQPPAIAVNASPLLNYAITVSTRDSSAIQSLAVAEQYDVSNKECIPIDHTIALGGTRPGVLQRFPVVSLRTAKDSFSSVVSVDRIRDQEYYGLGVCHWVLDVVYIDLTSHGRTYSAYIRRDDISSGNRITLYCQSRGVVRSTCYRNSGDDDFVLHVDIKKQ